MNLRFLSRKYLGWCPGALNAAEFTSRRSLQNHQFLDDTTQACLVIGFGFIFLGICCWRIEAVNSGLLREAMLANPTSPPRLSDVDLIFAPWSLLMFLVSAVPFLGAVYFHTISGALKRDYMRLFKRG